MLRLRDYIPQDFDALWALDQICFEPGIAYSKAAMRRYLRMLGTFAIVAEDKETGKIPAFYIGYVARERGYIITIDVHPVARGQQLGSKLMRAGEERMREAGARSIHLEVAVDNQPAVRFYERQGFQILRTLPGYYNGKLDAFKMLKTLTI